MSGVDKRTISLPKEQGIVKHVMKGLNDLKNGRFSSKSILDFKPNKS